MSRAAFLRGALLLILAWALASAAVLLWGGMLMGWLAPWLAFVSEQVLPGFDAYLSIITVDDAEQVEIAARAMEPFVIADALVLPPGATVRAGSHVSHALIPVVILFALLVAWPAQQQSTRLRRLWYALLLAVVLVSITTPLLLAGKLEMFFIEIAAREGHARSAGWLVYGTEFTEMGGRWLLPLLAAALTIIATREPPVDQPGLSQQATTG